MNEGAHLNSPKFRHIYVGFIFDVSKEDLKQLIRFDNQKNFMEDFISEIDGEIITLINGNEKMPYYDFNEILISATNYLGDKLDFNFKKGGENNLFDEICLKKIFDSMKKN